MKAGLNSRSSRQRRNTQGIQKGMNGLFPNIEELVGCLFAKETKAVEMKPKLVSKSDAIICET